MHGHDDGLLQAVARFLEKLQFEVVILQERPSQGRTIITKFREEGSRADFAVVLMTPDDSGGKAGSKVLHRARQNVVFELGYFLHALGSNRVVALVKGDLERPSDYDGVVYIPANEPSHWQHALANELKAANLRFDANRMFS